MNTKYPFDSSYKNHLLIALGLTIWIFVFLYFTEPLDVNKFSNSDKLLYLPGYGILGGLSYILFFPVQNIIYTKNKKKLDTHKRNSISIYIHASFCNTCTPILLICYHG